MITIRLFGSPEIMLDGSPVKLARRKSRAVLYYLAAHTHPVSRETLLSIFWPDTPRPAAQGTLRTTLYGLRQALGPSLLAEPEAVALEGDSRVDVRQFERALDPPPEDIASLQAALELYRGDFLADFSLPGVELFEDWALVEREHYRRMAIQGLSVLSAAFEAERDYTGALASLERALAFNPLQEDLQRESIRLITLAGDRPGAIRRYDQLRRLLDEELGVPPMAETRALYDAIINDRPLPPSPHTRAVPPAKSSGFAAISGKISPSGPVTTSQATTSPDTLPFTGRKAELKHLQGLAWAHKLILIEGEAGIGKTRLAEEFIRTSTALALTGRGRELEKNLPYQPAIEALRMLIKRADWPYLQNALQNSLPPVWLDEASRLLPELGITTAGSYSLGRTAEETRLWEGISQFLNALARLQPVILFLDDLHWSDASTLALLGYLLRQAQEVPLCFLATAQPIPSRSPFSTLLQTMIREDRLARLSLSRLTPEEVEEIARSLSPASPGPLADWLQSNSEGNPYILVELVREARASRYLLSDGKTHPDFEPGALVVPPSIYSLVQSRLERLSEPARRILDAAVAAGRVFEFEVVARAAGFSDSEALDALDELVAARLVHPLERTRFAFDHSLTMEVAYRDVGELRHRLLHRQIAEALESIHADEIDTVAGPVAWHFAEGNDLQRASPYAFQAGQQAARLAAWAEAIAFYEQALQGVSGPQRLPIWLALGEAHMRSGQFARASESYRDALRWVEGDSSDPTDAESADEIRLALARSLVTQARFAEVISLAQQVLQGGRNGSARAAQLMWGTALSLEGSDLEGAAEHLKAAEAICMKDTDLQQAKGIPEDLINLSQIRFELGSVLAQQGDLRQAVAHYRQALAAASQAESGDYIEQRILSYNNLAYHLLLLGDPSAKEYGEAGLRLAQEKGIIGLLPYLLSTLGEIALTGQDVDEAERYFTQGLNMAERLSMPERIAGLTANLGLAALQRGQTSLAIYRLSTALGQADAIGTQHLAVQIRLWLAPLLPPSVAQARLAEARATAESSGRKRLLEEAERLKNRLRLRSCSRLC